MAPMRTAETRLIFEKNPLQIHIQSLGVRRVEQAICFTDFPCLDEAVNVFVEGEAERVRSIL
jgi:hypothetical protein